MAKFVICTVYDNAVGAFMSPFFARSKNEAVRSFADAVADPKMEFGKHPNDYALFCIGEWDDKGELVAFERPTVLMEARDCMLVS